MKARETHLLEIDAGGLPAETTYILANRHSRNSGINNTSSSSKLMGCYAKFYLYLGRFMMLNKDGVELNRIVKV